VHCLGLAGQTLALRELEAALALARLPVAVGGVFARASAAVMMHLAEVLHRIQAPNLVDALERSVVAVVSSRPSKLLAVEAVAVISMLARTRLAVVWGTVVTDARCSVRREPAVVRLLRLPLSSIREVVPCRQAFDCEPSSMRLTDCHCSRHLRHPHRSLVLHPLHLQPIFVRLVRVIPRRSRA
jgi:hypothetical protein